MARADRAVQASPYLELLAVFAFAWAALGLYALALHGDVFVPAVAEAQPPVALRRESVTAHIDLPSERAPTTVVVAKKELRDPDRRPQRILLVGDSMVESILPRVSDYCAANGHDLLPAIWYASTTLSWARDSKLEELIGEFSPTMVIVSLGSSELSTPNVARHAPYIDVILRKIGDRKLVWIGPPNWREDTGINEVIRHAVGDDRFFRSADLSFDRKSDGIHPTPPSGVKWADAVVDWIGRESASPILLESPTRSVPKAAARVFPPP